MTEPKPRRERFAELSRAARRTAVLDAAGDLMREIGWNKVRMADVADRAGISRQTLYVDVGSREALAQEVVLREVVRFLDAVHDSISRHVADAQEAVVAAFRTFFVAAAENPLLRALVFDDGNQDLLPLFTTHGAPVLDAACGRLASFIRETWPDVDPDDAETLSECIIRLAISVATLPGHAPRVTPEAVARMLGPFAREITGTQQGG